MQFIYIFLVGFLFAFGISAESMAGAAHDNAEEMHEHEEDDESEEDEESEDQEEHAE